MNVLFKVEDQGGKVKEETGQSKKKGEQSSKRREDGKEEAISIVGAPDMQVISGLLQHAKFLSQTGKQHKSIPHIFHCFLVQLISLFS